jgi:hypothetical protein
MCEDVKDFPVISGGDQKYTMSDLFAWTNKEHISKFKRRCSRLGTTAARFSLAMVCMGRGDTE